MGQCCSDPYSLEDTALHTPRQKVSAPNAANTPASPVQATPQTDNGKTNAGDGKGGGGKGGKPPADKLSAKPTTQRSNSTVNRKAAKVTKAPLIRRHSLQPYELKAQTSRLTSSQNEPVLSSKSQIESPRGLNKKQASGAKWLRLESGSCSCKGYRPTMEDTCVVFDTVKEGCFDVGVQRSYYGIYDGHGGKEAALYCENNLHTAVLSDLEKRQRQKLQDAKLTATDSSIPVKCCLSSTTTVLKALRRGFLKTDRKILELSRKEGWSCGCTAVVVMFELPTLYTIAKLVKELGVEKFNRLLSNTSSSAAPSHIIKDKGSNGRNSKRSSEESHTGDVDSCSTSSGSELFDGFELSAPKRKALQTEKIDNRLGDLIKLGINRLYLANVGDSEAVLDRDGTAVLLSMRHRPTTSTEHARINAAGGAVMFGRVFGDLAISRAFGDHDYKQQLDGSGPFVIAEPFLTQVELTEKDKCVILACDGLWDTVKYQEAVDIVSAQRKAHPGITAAQISRVLATRAMEKHSRDNITVIVVLFHWDHVDIAELESSSSSGEYVTPRTSDDDTATKAGT